MADHRSSLPARRSRLIGRANEREVVRERLLHGDARLLTLTGAAGAGKTTLALEVGRSIEPLMPDGAWLVDLAVVRDAESIPIAMAGALGLLDHELAPLDALAEYLAARQALLVLDNCEHLLPALASAIDALLDRAPDLRILATSRVALDVRGQSVFVVPPFAVPAADDTDPARLAGVEAVQLFVERATAVNPAFALTATTAAAVASICRRLDGLPLAIELAAALASTLSPVEIDERLAAVGALHATSGGAGPERQRSLDATLDWSHGLLAPEAQAVFRRLAVFAGGWSLEAAAVVGSLGADPASVTPYLAQLVDHSLVVRESDGARSRYRMLAPIAEYALRRLAASDELGPASMAHATYFLQYSMSPYPTEMGRCLPEDIDRLAAEQENCLAAIRFAEQAGVVPLRLGLILNATALWRVRGQLHLAVRLLESALASTPEMSYERGVVLGLLAEFAHVLGDYDRTDSRATEAEAIFVPMAHPIGIRMMLGEHGLAAAGRGDFDGAMRAYEQARPYVEALPSAIAWAYWEAGAGRFELGRGNLEAARAHLKAADSHFRGAPSWYHGRVLSMLAMVAGRQGDHERAAKLFAAGLESLRAYGATVEAIASLEDMATVAIDQGDARRAATLLAASTGLRDATASAATIPDRAQLRTAIDAARAKLATGDFDAAWTAGLAMGLGDVVAFATTATREESSVASAAPRGSALTPREREIADLVALGLSNREIADRLVIAPGTVKIHVERILGKLGRTSRVQIATWAMDEREAAPAGDAA
jgi:serine/threonine-protein kinase PknK